MKVYIKLSTIWSSYRCLALKYLNTGWFTRWYQELAGFNFTLIDKKGKENNNADALSRSSQMAEALPLQEDDYAKFYEIDEPVVNFEEGVNEIQHIQCSLIEISEEQAKDKVWSEVISWIEQGWLPEKAERRQEVKQERF